MIGKQWIALAVVAAIFTNTPLQAASAKSSDEKEVMKTFNAFIESYGKDNAAVASTYHDGLVYGHSGGSFEDKAQVVRGLPSWDYAKVKSSTVEVTGPVAVVRTVMDFRVGGQRVTDMSILWVLLKERRAWRVLVRQAVKTTGTVIAPAAAPN